MKVHVVSYGDMECDNLLAIFSTKEKAEDYLEPYYEMEKKFGERCVQFFYPSITEVEVDVAESRFQFYSVVFKYDKGYLWHIRRVDYNSLDTILEWNKERGGLQFYTTSFDEEEIKHQAAEYFGVEEISWIVLGENEE